MAFTQKLLSFNFSLAQGVFAGGSNSATVSGLRASCEIVKAGGLSMGEAHVAIYGMTLSQMNQLSTYGMVLTNQPKNTITIKAGDDPKNLSTIYQGNITTAFMDGQVMPEVCFQVEAHVGSYEAHLPIASTTANGPVDVAQTMQQLAGQMSLAFENNGVSIKQTIHLHGSARTQAEELAQQAGIEWVIDNGTLAIWPSDQARPGSTTISAATGTMVGYPAFNSQGVIVKTIFLPTLEFGNTINVQSALTPACGSWVIHKLAYQLDSLVPKGRWFAVVEAHRPGQQVIA